MGRSARKRKDNDGEKSPSAVRIDAREGADFDVVSARQSLILRAWLVAMFCATLAITWPLWGDHADPPLLPFVELPRFDYFGWLLGLAYASCLRWPRGGLLASVAVGILAMTADQARMQPQIFSFWLLMLGTWREPSARFLGRCHLASLWFFSGFHKLLSDGYYEVVGPWLFHGLFPRDQFPMFVGYDRPFAMMMAGVESALGLMIFVRRLRPIVAVVAMLLHVGIVLTLWRLDGWNPSVWPWNLALAPAAAAACLTWKTPLIDEPRRCGWGTIGAGTLLTLSPALFYAGALDAYLCHCLYSANVPSATMFKAEDNGFGYSVNDAYWRFSNTPMPPTHRNFERYFRAVAKPGDMMVVDDPRDWAQASDYGRYAWRFDGKKHERVPLPTPLIDKP